MDADDLSAERWPIVFRSRASDVCLENAPNEAAIMRMRVFGTADRRAERKAVVEACRRRVEDLRGNLVPLVKPGLYFTDLERKEIEATTGLILDAVAQALAGVGGGE